MGKPKGKTPSLLSMSTGTPEVHTCGKATPCGRCEENIPMGTACFRIPKQKSGFTSRPLYCLICTRAIIEQTKSAIEIIERSLPNNL